MKIENRIRKIGMIFMLLVMFFGVSVFTGSVTSNAAVTGTNQKTYNVSTDKNKPVHISLNQTLTGPMWIYEQWYSFTTNEAITLTGTYTSERGRIEIYNSIEQRIGESDSDEEFTYKLEAGTYTVRVIAGGSNEIYAGKEYTLALNGVPYNWGTLKVDWNVNNAKSSGGVPFKITIEGSPDTYIFDAGDGSVSYGKRVDNGWSGNYSTHNGYNILKVIRYAEGYGLKTDIFEYVVKPSPATLKAALFKVTGTTASVDVKGIIQRKQGNKWVNVPTTQAYPHAPQMIKGLKPDTAYTFRAVTYVETAGKPTIYGEPSSPVTIVTPTKKKVSIKSVKASGFKTKYVKKKYVGGHYNVYGRWIGGHYEGGYYYTSYKLKIKLNKKVPGLKTKFLYINGKKCKVKGKNYVITQGYKGKRSKKKIKVTIYTAKDEIYQAYGPKTKKNVTIH